MSDKFNKWLEEMMTYTHADRKDGKWVLGEIVLLNIIWNLQQQIWNLQDKESNNASEKDEGENR